MSQNYPKTTDHEVLSGQNFDHYDRKIFAWRTPEYIRHERGKTWYFIAVIIVILLVFTALLSRNWTMALAVLAFAGVYYNLHIQQHPREIEIVISELGIKVGNMVFPYSHIEAFWIFYQPPFVKTLNLRVQKRYSDVVIQLGDQDPALLRQFLCTQIPELEGKNEALTDILLRLFKL